MLKPYSFRNEFLLTLIAGGMCATMHYLLTQPEHFEESVNVFALIGLLAMCGNWWVFSAREANHTTSQFLKLTVLASIMAVTGGFAVIATSGFPYIITPWSIVVGVAVASPFIFKSLAMSDEKFREYYGYVPVHADPVPVYAVITSLLLSVTCLVLLLFGHKGHIIMALVSASSLVKQDVQKQFYRHNPMWPHLILIAIYGGLWGYTLGYLNNI